jgi:AraC-like DNA-binding protein
MSPLGYLNRLRCKIGGELLRHTDLTVAAVSDNVGYENASDFYRHFIATYGMSPSEFRERNS